MCLFQPVESEIAGWLSVVFRFVHVLAAIMWIGNSILFTWMELNLIAPKPEEENSDLLGYLDMLHGGGVFHLEKRVIKPSAIPVPLHWFMWQSYTTWISGALLMISVFYLHGGSSLLNPAGMDLQGWKAVSLSAGGILAWWLVYDAIWRSKLKDHPRLAVPLTLALILAAAAYFNQFFNGHAVFLHIGAMLGSAMSANVFLHIIQNQKKFMKSLLAGLPHDLKYGKQAKLRSMHNHYMTFPVLFMMLSAHFPQLTSTSRTVPILGVIIVALVTVKWLMNSRYGFRHWLISIFATFILACLAIGFLVAEPAVKGAAAAEGGKLFVSQGCAACHQLGSAQIAPNLSGVYHSTRVFSDDTTTIADEAYLRESIRQPHQRIVKGYAAAMPPYAHLTDAQVDQLLAYLKSL
jgi:uncharacterized membrane protein